MTHGKTYNKSPRRINHKAIKSKTNTGTTALEMSVEQITSISYIFPQGVLTHILIIIINNNNNNRPYL